MAYDVLLVEDEPDTRERLETLINGSPDMKIIASCDRLAPALAAHQQYMPDVLVTDINLPDGLGYELIEKAHKANPDCSILVITVLGDEAALMKAIEAGAHGYLLKSENQENIVSKIKEVVNGGSPISSTMARYLLNRFSGEPEENKENMLTTQEQRTLSCIARGYTYKETAEQLSVSANTVPSYIKGIYSKLQVHSRGEAVYEALRRGILDPPAQ